MPSKSKPNPIVEKYMTRLCPHGPVTCRAMFGGYGIYFDKVIFASIVENELYFRVDEWNREDFEAYNSKPFVYEGQGKPITMPYMQLPDEILNDPKLLPAWIQKAYHASLRYAPKRKKKPRRISHAN